MKRLNLFLLLLMAAMVMPATLQAKKIKYGKNIVYDEETSTLTMSVGKTQLDRFKCSREQDGSFTGMEFEFHNSWKCNGEIKALVDAQNASISYTFTSATLIAPKANGYRVQLTVESGKITRSVSNKAIITTCTQPLIAKGASKPTKTVTPNGLTNIEELTVNWIGKEWASLVAQIYHDHRPLLPEREFGNYTITYTPFVYANSVDTPDAFIENGNEPEAVSLGFPAPFKYNNSDVGHVNITIDKVLKDGKDTGERVISYEGDSMSIRLSADKELIGARLVKSFDDKKLIIEKVIGGENGKAILTYADGSRFEGTINGDRRGYLCEPLYGELGNKFSQYVFAPCSKSYEAYQSAYAGVMTYSDGRTEELEYGEPKGVAMARIAAGNAAWEAKQAAKAKEEKEAYDALCKKYGKQYVDAALKFQVIVGMPEELMVAQFAPQLELKEQGSSYKVYYRRIPKLIKSKYESDYTTHIIWVRNGKVSNVRY